MKRKQFLGTLGGALAGAAAAPLLTGCASGPSGGERRNVVIIMADDMGYSDIGCFGGEALTPNIDSLAAGGIRFTNFYNAARCCPTRASLLTGLYPHRAGMGAMVSGECDRPAGPYQGWLNNSCVTIAEALGRAGYRSYMSGKWHVGECRGTWPCDRGFDRYFGLVSGANSYWEMLEQPGRRRRMLIDNDEWYPPRQGFYMTDAFSDHAVRFLHEHQQGEHSERPFFLYLAYTAPHWPLHAWPEDIAKYRGRFKAGWDVLRRERHERMRAMGLIDPDLPLSPRDPEVPAWEDVPDKEHQQRLMEVYAAMIDRMDQGIGQVLAQLKRMGADENTLVLFLSDNGGCHERIDGRNLNQPGVAPGRPGSFVAYRRPWANLSNTPFRMFKHWVHEGGISTPLIARWPAAIAAPGSINTTEVGHVIDLLPTALDLACTGYPSGYEGREIVPCDGLSLLPVLRGARRQGHEALYWEHMGNRAVRRGKLKLVAKKGGPWELYNLGGDRVELNNLIAGNGDEASELERMYAAWAEDVGVDPERYN